MPPKGWRGQYNIKLRRLRVVAKTVISKVEQRAMEREAKKAAEKQRLETMLREVAENQLAQLLQKRGKEVAIIAKEYAERVVGLPDKIAAIIGKTYPVMGDGAALADDEAIMRIRDELLELDAEIIERNRNKRLKKR